MYRDNVETWTIACQTLRLCYDPLWNVLLKGHEVKAFYTDCPLSSRLEFSAWRTLSYHLTICSPPFFFKSIPICFISWSRCPCNFLPLIWCIIKTLTYLGWIWYQKSDWYLFRTIGYTLFMFEISLVTIMCKQYLF